MRDQQTNELIQSILSAFGGRSTGHGRDISKDELLTWMNSPDLETRGVIYTMITDKERSQHIKPSLETRDCYDFIVTYLEECIVKDPDTEWTDSRYLAGHALVAWINSFWNDQTFPRQRLTEIKERLAALYKNGDDHVRDGVLNGVLEHLFERPSLAKFFKDWKDDPILSKAYSDAMLWPDIEQNCP